MGLKGFSETLCKITDLSYYTLCKITFKLFLKRHDKGEQLPSIHLCPSVTQVQIYSNVLSTDGIPLYIYYLLWDLLCATS